MLLELRDVPVYVYTGGRRLDTSLPALVFIHGAQNDHSVWALQSRYLAHHGHGVVAPDLPGHGRSGGKPLTSIEAMSDWVLALLDGLGLRQAVLVGHSMGALIALEMAAQAPDRVRGLALLGIAFPMKVSDALLDASLQAPDTAADMVNLWSHSTLAPKPASPGPGFWVMGMSKRLMQHLSTRSDEPLFRVDLDACNRYAGGEEAAQRLRCPTLFMLGALDQMAPSRNAALLRRALPDAQTVTLPCGHQMMSEQPDAVLDGLRSFIAGLPETAAPVASASHPG